MWDLRELQLIFGNEMNLALAERAFTEVLYIVVVVFTRVNLA